MTCKVFFCQGCYPAYHRLEIPFFFLKKNYYLANIVADTKLKCRGGKFKNHKCMDAKQFLSVQQELDFVATGNNY